MGNSFTLNATEYLPAIIRSDKDGDAYIAVATRGGATMQFHVKKAGNHEANKEAGKVYNYRYNDKWKMDNEGTEQKFSMKEILLDDKWDYITIQQGSPKSPILESFYPLSRELKCNPEFMSEEQAESLKMCASKA